MSLLYANIANLGNLIFMGNLFKYKNTKTFYTHGLLTTGILKYLMYSGHSLVSQNQISLSNKSI